MSHIDAGNKILTTNIVDHCSLYYSSNRRWSNVILWPSQSWEANVTGGLKTGGFQMGYCNLEKSALYFICKRGDFTLLKPKQNKKEGAVLKV